MQRTLILIGAACTFLLVACAARQPAPESPHDLLLLPPDEITNEILLQQKLTLLANGQEQHFLAVARLERDRIRLLLFAPSGQQLLALNFDGELLHQRNAPGFDVPGKEILASLQFALWPVDSIRRHYQQDDGWDIEIDKRGRSLLTSSGPLLIIRQDSEKVWLDNLQRKYRVIIETLEQREL